MTSSHQKTREPLVTYNFCFQDHAVQPVRCLDLQKLRVNSETFRIRCCGFTPDHSYRVLEWNPVFIACEQTRSRAINPVAPLLLEECKEHFTNLVYHISQHLDLAASRSRLSCRSGGFSSAVMVVTSMLMIACAFALQGDETNCRRCLREQAEIEPIDLAWLANDSDFEPVRTWNI